VVLRHGSSGVLEEREVTYARQLAAMGVAALVVDTFGARRDRATSFIDRLLKITESMMLADAYAALRYLDGRPEIDGNRVALIGFSYGGMAATYAAYAQVAESYAPDGERFAAHVAYYGPCIAEFEDSRATGAPLLMLHGGKDEIVDAKRCAEVAAALESGGSQVKTIVYPEAFHQWDGRFGNPRRIGRNLSPCRFQVARDGTVTAPFWPFAMSDSFNRRMMLGMCSESEGYMIGRDDKVRDRSNADLARFLETVFASENTARAQSAARLPPKRN
jgi:dienelactone hydrolase